MPAQPTPPTPAKPPAAQVRSFIGWAFLISLGLHVIVVPFFHPHRNSQDKAEVEKVSVTKKIKVVVPTPPPPTPTPPPPTPPPKQTPPPVKQTNPPPQPKLKLNVPKTTAKTDTANNETKYVQPPVGNENGNPQGTTDKGPAVPASTAPPATPAPTPAPPTPTPKPACAVPNKDAAIKGSAAEADYPDIAKQQGAVGTTQVKVSLDAAGGIASVTVYKSSGNQALDNSALAAAKATSYTPETVNCVPEAGSYLFRVDFTGN
jgi:TonB family protein